MHLNFINPLNPVDAMQEFAVSLPVLALSLVAAVLFVSRIKQVIWKPKPQNRPRRFRISARNAAVGLAFLPFAAIYRPRLIEVAKAQIRQQEDVDEDDSGGPETPLKHLMRQLRRIRRGEPVETLFLRRE
jgi:amino acid transporter